MGEIPKTEEGQEEVQEKDLHTRVLEALEKAKENDDWHRKNRGGELPEIFAEIDQEGFVKFGVISHDLLGKQSQYGSRYINKNFSDEYPYLGDGIGIKGNPDDYHEVRVYKDDIEEFVRRYEEYMKSIGAI
ncbi:MAG: hypothetical protein Q7S53_05065 [bacterium]|nr:hypothetical protein [bacterium]